MADSTILKDGLEGEPSLVTQKMRDLGDGTWCESVVNEGVPTSETQDTLYSNSSASSLVSAVNSHRTGSSDRYLGVVYFSDGLLTPTFYAVITERT